MSNGASEAMMIKTVEYRALKSYGRYENVTIGVVAELGPDDEPENVLERAERWVNAQIDRRVAESERAEREEHEVTRASYELESIRREIRDAGEKWERVRAFMAKHGVDLDESLPF